MDAVEKASVTEEDSKKETEIEIEEKGTEIDEDQLELNENHLRPQKKEQLNFGG